MIKTILAIVENVHRAEPFLRATLALADRWQAHAIIDILTVAPLAAPSLAPLGTLYTPPFELERLADEKENVVRGILAGHPAAEIVAHLDEVGWIPGHLRRTAPLADLIMVGAAPDWTIDWLRRRTIETLLLSSGTPLLLLPSAATLNPVRHVVLGWKSGPHATRALHALVSLLAPGTMIEVVNVKHGIDDQPEESLAPVRHLLERHGLTVETHAIDRAKTTTASLRSFAQEHRADLLVIGGFAHSRMREILLGGVTRGLIEEPGLPVIMVH